MAIEQVWREHERKDPQHYDNRLLLKFINVGRVTCFFRGHDWEYGRYRTSYGKPYYDCRTDVCRRCDTIQEKLVSH